METTTQERTALYLEVYEQINPVVKSAEIVLAIIPYAGVSDLTRLGPSLYPDALPISSKNDWLTYACRVPKGRKFARDLSSEVKQPDTASYFDDATLANGHSLERSLYPPKTPSTPKTAFLTPVGFVGGTGFHVASEINQGVRGSPLKPSPSSESRLIQGASGRTGAQRDQTGHSSTFSPGMRPKCFTLRVMSLSLCTAAMAPI